MWDTEILVARHGETDWNREGKWQGSSDVPLNSLGQEQAESLASSLKGEDIRYIYSSDLSRAYGTADIVKRSLNPLAVHQDQRLRERNLGKFEGWSVTQVAKYMGLSEDDASSLEVDELKIDNMPSVEKWSVFTTRVWDALNEINQKHLGSKCLVVAHGGVMRAITMNLANGSEPKLNFKNTELLRIRTSNGKWDLEE